ncbi:Dol-P-Man:Man(5)GlcNAc(2)-PP-Dol alpha-1,3-mannosyltransferase [Wallemia ichthyophaga EXF-994]|uniref:Dol-P-Man:Man(5)GlcNAc(2)-PP-Dol alpha-1,3-mannosyltransferase n=1 Tax=Wallemia ichthyophaga (strain EXF-994 / CBS 113033) TaxID=1299270 RepID=R9ACN4_WALI9|nr:Dol-P-Man:Man(5)GlcNAc(2)-PP-Dol alpha-1,3-mannosyltransferase [Wallemia ichthyophaga EXF-994]EOQ99968.1 Dol-P-Man:Man(5)GlcNAc(2)-PP-Dol alpha-1,3-mannosyltransferase [Wallemia ichthyophaga EXF-994]
MSELIRSVNTPPINHAFTPSNHLSPFIILTSTIETLNNPNALVQLYESYLEPLNLTNSDDLNKATNLTHVIRECCLKTITLNGVPKAINSLSAIRGVIPEIIKERISNQPQSRALTSENLDQFKARGEDLWESIYHPFHEKLVNILNQNHPDMGRYIIDNHYAALLAPPSPDNPIGRVETSIIAVACLRTQGGVKPQLLSHAYGLQKAGESEFGWIASDVGVQWVIESTDKIIKWFK